MKEKASLVFLFKYIVSFTRGVKDKGEEMRMGHLRFESKSTFCVFCAGTESYTVPHENSSNSKQRGTQRSFELPLFTFYYDA